jgi:hypothetical protein
MKFSITLSSAFRYNKDYICILIYYSLYFSLFQHMFPKHINNSTVQKLKLALTIMIMVIIHVLSFI